MPLGYDELLYLASARTALNKQVKSLLAESLDLDLSPELIGDDQPLFGRGLELDSLDTLEIVVMFEEHLGVTISDDDRAVFGSVNRLTDFVVETLGGLTPEEPDGVGAAVVEVPA
jgi:acyl carrier protein